MPSTSVRLTSSELPTGRSHLAQREWATDQPDPEDAEAIRALSEAGRSEPGKPPDGQAQSTLLRGTVRDRMSGPQGLQGLKDLG